MSEAKFVYKRTFFDNDFNLAFISIFGLPFILIKKGSLDLTFGCIIFTIYSMIIYFSLSNIFKIVILNNETELINIFGKKTLVPNNKIFFSEEYYRKETRDSLIYTRKLKIQLPNKKIIFYKDEEPNYDEVTAYCKEKYTHSNKKSTNYIFYIIPLLIICSGIYLLFFTINSFEKKKQNNLKSIQEFGYIKLEGTFQDYKNIGKSGTFILIQLKEYPEFDFSPIISIQNSSEFDNKLSTKGEKIIVYISPNEYKKKIKKSIPQNFYDKYFSYNEITIYKLE